MKILLMASLLTLAITVEAKFVIGKNYQCNGTIDNNSLKIIFIDNKVVRFITNDDDSYFIYNNKTKEYDNQVGKSNGNYISGMSILGDKSIMVYTTFMQEGEDPTFGEAFICK